MMIKIKDNLFSDYYLYSGEQTVMQQGEYMSSNRRNVGYSILVNNEKVFPLNGQHTPINSYRVRTLPQTIRYEQLKDGRNEIEVRFFSSEGRAGSFFYTIYREELAKEKAIRDGEFIDGYEADNPQWFGSIDNKIYSLGTVVPTLDRQEGNDKFYSAKINDSEFEKIKILER